MRPLYLGDFAAHFQKGFRNNVVPIKEVPELVKKFEGYGCYATYFFFSDEILTYMSAHTVDSSPSIAGYEGKVWAPFCAIDLDHPDFGATVEAARLLVSLFMNRWGADPNSVQTYFSGSKGFHLMIDTRLFGRILPSKSLPLIFDAMRRHLAQELPVGLRDTVDLGIKDRVRLLRLPNTVHEKSGLYKVIISPEELALSNPEKIRGLAAKPRPLALTDETGFLSRVPVHENDEAAALLKKVRQQIKRVTRKPFRYHFRRPEDLSRLDFACAGLQTIWKSHVEPGCRNNCAIRLASELRLMGFAEGEAAEKLFEWNRINSIGLPSYELHNVIRSAYQHPYPYRYGCGDDLLRRFCSLPNYDACQKYIASHSGRDERNDSSKSAS